MASWVRVVHAQLLSDWMLCANENETCVFTGTKEVRYGANGLYAYHATTDGTPVRMRSSAIRPPSCLSTEMPGSQR
jgi:hypothetical protein